MGAVPFYDCPSLTELNCGNNPNFACSENAIIYEINEDGTKTIVECLQSRGDKIGTGKVRESEFEKLIAQDNLDELRICNVARNALLAIIGTFPAEWDLVIAPHTPAIDENGIVRKRDFFPDVCVYAEDIRSPFNIGSIFRTAEAMGADKVFISPRCIEPTQPRAIRSAMGCIETMGWNRCDLSQLPEDLPVFALETGGTDINDFVFPKKGICIIGSEELGVSPEALKRADYGRVTIPMKGLKASLNVGVAFGILMQKWVESLQK